MVLNSVHTTKSAQETKDLGEELGHYVSQKEGNATVICLYGDLGSGKTTFVQGFAKGLGIRSRLLSPTFIIVRRYSLIERAGFLYHIDLYRIKNEKDLRELGISEILADTHSFVLIEWAEKLDSLLPSERVNVRCMTLENGNHQVVVQTTTVI